MFRLDLLHVKKVKINKNNFIFFSELFIERHENVTIIFADICKFTELTTRLSVDKLVKTLNDLFGKFDSAAEVRNKTFFDKFVKTLNDLYGKFDSAAEVRNKTFC